MKILLTLLFFVGANFAKAQQLSTFYDATSNNAGFSYNITISYKLLKGWSKARPSEIYSVKLVSVTTDSRGFYYGNQRNKFYSCSEIGNNCNPNNWQQVYVGLNGKCKTSVNKKLSFSRINEETTIESWIEENGACTFDNIEGNVRQDGTRNLMNIIDAKENSSENKIAQNNNPTTKTNTEEEQVTATPNNTTTKPLDNYDANTGLYSNPMTNSSNGSSYDKDLQRAELVVDVANGILDLFATSPEEKAREEREAAETRARAERYAAEKKALAEREENLRRENEAAAAAAKAKRIQMIASRKTLFKTFPDGKTPLSYQAKEATEVYFFTYSYQAATLEEDTPLIYISNVFSVSKYGDGSWPFKSNLIANIAKTNKGLDLILSGYYESREKAEEEQQLLISTANSYEFSVKSISYVGIKSDDKPKASADFWGNETNQGSSKTIAANKNNQASKNSAGEQDFWGNPTIKDKKKAVSSTEKKQANKVTKEDTDFWGNTTKTTRVMVYGYVYFQKCNSEEVQYYRKLLVDEDSYQEESKNMEEKLNEDYPNAKRIMVGSSKFEYGSGVDHMCLIKWRAGSKACSYFVHSISFGKTQKEALNNALNKKNTYADKKAAYEIVEQKYW